MPGTLIARMRLTLSLKGRSKQYRNGGTGRVGPSRRQPIRMIPRLAPSAIAALRSCTSSFIKMFLT